MIDRFGAETSVNMWHRRTSESANGRRFVHYDSITAFLTDRLRIHVGGVDGIHRAGMIVDRVVDPFGKLVVAFIAARGERRDHHGRKYHRLLRDVPPADRAFTIPRRACAG